MTTEIMNLKTHVPRETKLALKEATRKTGRLQRDIIRDALEDWLVQYGFLDEDAPVVQG